MTRARTERRPMGSAGFEEFEAPALEGSAKTLDDVPPIGPLVRGNDRDGEDLPPAMARIVRRIFTLDVEDAFERVTRGLREGKNPAHRAEYGDVVDELDEASELNMLAHQLAANAAVTVARYEADLEVLRSSMRAQAVASLNEERERAVKASETRAPKPKQINESDVESRMAASFPGEYQRLATLLAEAKQAAKFIAALPDQWGARRRELDGRVRTIRKG